MIEPCSRVLQSDYPMHEDHNAESLPDPDLLCSALDFNLVVSDVYFLFREDQRMEDGFTITTLRNIRW